MIGFRGWEMHDTGWLCGGFPRAGGRREMIFVEPISALRTCYQRCEHPDAGNPPEMENFGTISSFWNVADDEREQGRARHLEMIDT